MGLLDGEIRGIIGDSIDFLLSDGILHQQSTAPDGYGGFTSVDVDATFRGFISEYSSYERGTLGIPSSDLKMTITQASLSISPAIDDELTFEGVRYTILDIGQDPASATYDLRVRKL